MGGEQEQMRTKNNHHSVYVAARRGHLRLALKQGVPIVPIYCFGEVDLYTVITFFLDVRIWLVKAHRIALPFGNYVFGGLVGCFYWCPIFDCATTTTTTTTTTTKSLGFFLGWGRWWCPILPKPLPLVSCFGAPIPVEKVADPSAEQIDELQKRYRFIYFLMSGICFVVILLFVICLLVHLSFMYVWAHRYIVGLKAVFDANKAAVGLAHTELQIE